MLPNVQSEPPQGSFKPFPRVLPLDTREKRPPWRAPRPAGGWVSPGFWGGLARTSFSLWETQPSGAWVVPDGASRHPAQPRAGSSGANGGERLVAPKSEGVNAGWNACQPTRLCKTRSERLALTKHRHRGAYTRV